MKLQTPRPEDRSRHGTDSPAWADTHPACFRSEGFAEDLADLLGAGAAGAQPAAQRSKWGLDATLPVLGLALAGAIGVFAR